MTHLEILKQDYNRISDLAEKQEQIKYSLLVDILNEEKRIDDLIALCNESSFEKLFFASRKYLISFLSGNTIKVMANIKINNPKNTTAIRVYDNGGHSLVKNCYIEASSKNPSHLIEI